MENYNNTINDKIFGLIHQNYFIACECYFTSIDLNFDSTNVKLKRHMNSVCSMITRSENAALQDSNIIELNLSRDCNKQECQDVFSMKQKHLSIVI